jgi:UDP-N-acetyl-D-mannosaminuronic acid transferase (WecB/TagA/CpsF family)
MNIKAGLRPHPFLHYWISCEPVSELVRQLLDVIQHRARHLIFAFANARSLRLARKNECFRHALLRGGVLVANDVGLTARASSPKKDSFPSVTGTEYFEKLTLASHSTERLVQ